MSASGKQFTLWATALGSSLAFIDASAVVVALPTMQKALNLGLAGQQWIFLSYSLALAALYLVGGALGDRYGHKRVFTQGVIGFALASLLAGLAPSGELLIAARVLQGVFGAMVTTNSLAWLRRVYRENSGKAVGLWTSLTGVSTVLAPPLGGALTQWLSWRWIFYINLPLACLIIYFTKRAADDNKQTEEAQSLDIAGSALIALSFGLITYFLVQGAQTSFSELWWALGGGLAALLSFLVVEAKTKHPLLPYHLFKFRNFSFSNLETLLIYGALNGVFIYFTLYLQFLSLSPLASSLFLIPVSVALILFAPYFGSLADKVGPRLLLTIGPALIALGCWLFSLIDSQDQIWTIGGLGVLAFSGGLAMLVAPITTTALKSVPSKFAGVASGLNNTVARVGGLIMVALVGMIISIIFFNRVDNKQAVPLDLHQSEVIERQASTEGYKNGMRLVAATALASAFIGWFGISNKKTKN